MEMTIVLTIIVVLALVLFQFLYWLGQGIYYAFFHSALADKNNNNNGDKQ